MMTSIQVTTTPLCPHFSPDQCSSINLMTERCFSYCLNVFISLFSQSTVDENVFFWRFSDFIFCANCTIYKSCQLKVKSEVITLTCVLFKNHCAYGIDAFFFFISFVIIDHCCFIFFFFFFFKKSFHFYFPLNCYLQEGTRQIVVT